MSTDLFGGVQNKFLTAVEKGYKGLSYLNEGIISMQLQLALQCIDSAILTRSFICILGYYCTSGVDRSQPGTDNSTMNYTCPAQAIQTGHGGVCPLGHYCPESSTIPLPCEAGSYADMEGMASCTVCPEGFFCLANSSEFLSMPCPTGHYCPNGTEHGTQYKCPEGTYNSLEEGRSLNDCQDCPPGKYCEGQGNSNPTGNCTAGWYCTGAAESLNSTLKGGVCPAGNYCPEGKKKYDFKLIELIEILLNSNVI